MPADAGPEPLRTWTLRPEDFLRPLEVLRRVHDRQEAVCDRLDELTEHLSVDPIADQARVLLGFLGEELPLHIADEEEDLFRLLEQRCRPEDRLHAVLGQLSHEHELDEDLTQFLVADLERLAQGFRLSNPVRLLNNVRAFTATQRRHLAWENATVLPLAEKRLSAEDLAQLGRRMAGRRGIAYPEAGPGG